MSVQKNSLENNIHRTAAPETIDDAQALIDFIHQHTELICTEPARAYGALKDVLAKKDHLIPGSREIIIRSEWSTILAGDKDTTVRALQAKSLREWIISTYSTQTAAPWLEAIAEQLQDTDHSDINSKYSGAPSQPLKRDSNINKYWPILAGAVAIIALLRALNGYINTIEKRNPDMIKPLPSERAASTSRIHTSNSSQDNSGVLIPLRDRENLQPNQYTDADIRRMTDGHGGQENSRRSQIGGARDYTNDNELATQKQGINWKRIAQQLDNGELNTADLSDPIADNILRHWVQAFKANRNTLSIVLRTRSEASKRACELVLTQYQKAYRSTAGRFPYVVLESSRHAGRDSSQGFLPVCELSPAGDLTLK